MKKMYKIFILVTLLFCFSSRNISFAESILTKVSLNHRSGGISVNSTTNKIYIGSSNSSLFGLTSNSLSVIDGKTHSVEAMVDFDLTDFDVKVAVNSTANKIYAINGTNAEHRKDKIFVVDGVTSTIQKTIDVGFPVQLGINPTTNKIYINNYGGFGMVGVFDGSTDTLTTTIDLMISSTPVAITVNPNNNKIYVVDNFKKVCVIDGVSNTVTNTIDLGKAANTPLSIAVNTKNNKIYVSDKGADKIIVIDGDTNNTTAEIEIMSPLELAVNSETNRIYVFDNVMNAVCVIDGTLNKVVDVIILGGMPNGVAVNSETNKIYLSNSINKNIVVLDGSVIAPTPIINQVQNAISELSSTQGLLIVGPLSKKLGTLIKRLESSLDSKTNKCKRTSHLVLAQIKKTITKIESVDAPPLRKDIKNSIDKTTDNCIPVGLFEEKDRTPLQESFSIIQSAFLIDEDKDKTPDLCERWIIS